MQNSEKDDDVVLSLVLLLIAALCLGFSFVTMTYGYEKLVGNLIGSGALSLILVLMLFALNFKLRQGLMRGMGGREITAIMLLYLIVVFASFSGLFNRFYSQFMQDELIKTELQVKEREVDDLKNRVTEFLSDPDLSAKRQKIDAMLTQLSAQIQNPMEPGLGAKARDVVAEIQKELGKKLTVLTCNNMTTAGLKRCADLYEKMVRDAMRGMAGKSANSAEREQYIEQVTREVAKVRLDLIEQAKRIGDSNPVVRADARQMVETTVGKYKEIVSRAKNLRTDGTLSFKEDIRCDSCGVGKISDTFRSAISNWKHWAVWISAFLALMIDLVVPLFVYVLTPRGRKVSVLPQRRTTTEAL